MKYRGQIGNCVREIVQQMLAPDASMHWIQHHAANAIPGAGQAQFIDTIRAELRGLHEGNIARYRLRPSEFTQWKSKTS